MTAQDQQSRAEFEACIKANFKLEDGWWCRQLPDGGYSAGNVDSAWKVWQAARALPAGIKPLSFHYRVKSRDGVERVTFYPHDSDDILESEPVYTAAQAQAMGRVPDELTDADLSAIYKQANGEDVGKAGPLTTVNIFRAMRAMLAAATRPPAAPAWEPKFDIMSPRQEELAIQFCNEISGPLGKPGRAPDPVRLLEMAEELYKAERDEVRDAVEAS